MSLVHSLMTPRRLSCRFTFLTFLILANSTHQYASAQPQSEKAEADDVSTAKPDTITVEKIESLRKQVDAATDVDPDTKTKALDSLQQASDQLKRAAELDAQARDFKAKVDSAPTRQQERKKSLAGANDPTYDDLPETPALSDLQAAVARRTPRVQEAKSKLTEREAEPTVRVERRKLLADLLAKHGEQRADLETQFRAAAPTDESPVATIARRALLEAKLLVMDRDAPAYQQELALFDTEKALELPSLRVQLQKREVVRLEEEIAELNRRIEVKRQAEARSQVEELREFAAKIKDSNLQNRAEDVADLADVNQKLSAEITKSTNSLQTATKKLDALIALSTRMRGKEGLVGLTEAIGLELRRHLRSLPNIGDLRRESHQRQNLMREIQFKQLGYEDASILAEQEIAQLELVETRNATQELELRIENERKDILALLDKNYSDQFNKLSSLDAKTQQTITTAEAFRTYINERVLWIRSNRIFWLPEMQEAATTFGWLINPVRWAEVAGALRVDFRSSYLFYIVAALIVLALICTQGRCRRTITRIGKRAAKSTFCEFMPTLRVALLTGLLALPWPIVLCFFGWRLISPPVGSEFSVAVGNGLIAVAVFFLLLNLVRQSCRPHGLGISHFNWPTGAAGMLRLRVFGLMTVVLPVAFIAVTLRAHENPQGRDALERLAFIVGLMTLAWFMFGVFHPTRGVFRAYLLEHRTGWANRTRPIWYPLSFGVPIVLTLMAFFGYFFTAGELTWRLEAMIWVLATLFYIREFLVRWFVVNHRSLRIEQARQRRIALKEAAEAETPTNPGTEDSPAVDLTQTIVEEKTDLQIVGEQTNRLINTALLLAAFVFAWFLWVDVLPALRILDNYKLWSTTVEATVESLDADGVASVITETRVVPITIASLLAALLFGVITFTAARNVPGLLEIALLQRLPVHPATRYAIRTVTRYVIMVVGIVLTFGAIGVGWAKVQWLAAALTVGLGFGLQEIFANFVSGLIILFERPVRIGDVVTIDSVSGTVSRIQIRATTITDWDRKDYIVPNKEFVTGRLLNWTLLDSTNRIVIHGWCGLRHGHRFGSIPVAERLQTATKKSFRNLHRLPRWTASATAR